jgi:hypothetical protein
MAAMMNNSLNENRFNAFEFVVVMLMVAVTGVTYLGSQQFPYLRKRDAFARRL